MTSVPDQPDLAEGAIVEGPALAEPLRLAGVSSVGDRVRLIGEGLNTNRFHQLLLTKEQAAELSVAPAEGSFDGDGARFKVGIEALRLGLAYEYDPYFSLSISRVDPLPHQVEAVYDYMLPLPRIRFLLADDAGAGKTIMAGLLLRELKLRGLVERTLIVAPANLAFQWQREMSDRFRERFDIIRGVDLRNAYGVNPWDDHAQVITSIDWAKREGVKDSLGRTRWDLVFVDEAHRMSASDAEHKTERYRLGELLGDRSDHMVLLTATPHKGDPDNFALFLQLLDADAFAHVRSLEDAIEAGETPFYLRRTKEALVSFPDPDSGEVRRLFTKRETKTAAFDLDSEELDLYEAVTRYVQDQSLMAASDSSARGRAIGFTMAMYQRRLASSVHAALRSLERRVERIDKKIAGLGRERGPVDFDERDLEDVDELTEEETARLEDRAEEASLAIDRAHLETEKAQILPLIDQARSLVGAEVSSKLAKLREVLTDQKIFANPDTKLLVFTEHKDTLDFLVGRLTSWGLTVTQIHGSMKVGDRDTPGTRLYAEREFREQAQVMVATEAAGEGINLQFCWLMVNYDIPWNPMRLEQRIGRIHRYGQEKDCLVFNFVAENTREGQVLQTLLDRLDEIRSALGSEHVFDVVGQVVPANFVERLLRDHYAGRITTDQVLDRIVEEVEPERFERITRSALEGLARRDLNLTRLVAKRAEAKERRLVPEVVEAFFYDAAPISGLRPTQERKYVARVGRLPRHILQIAESQEGRFGRLGREYRRITFDKSVLEKEPTVEWVTPGHPLFEAVRIDVSNRVADDLRRGAVFYELNRDQAAQLDVFAASVKDGMGQTLHRRLFVVEMDECGISLRQPTLFLDLVSAPAAVAPDVPSSNRHDAESFLLAHGLEPFLDEVRLEREREVEAISRHIEVALASLIDRQQVKVDELMQRNSRGEDVSLALAESERRLDDFNDRLERRRQELSGQREFALADMTHMGSAWVLPHPEREGALAPMVSDPHVEAVAVEAAMEYERQAGRVPVSVESENRGFDLVSTDPATGLVRFIEVKGRATRGPVALSANEYRTAERLREDYWLYAVFNCSESPRLLPVRDPIRLGWEAVTTVEHFRTDQQRIEEAAAE